MRSPSVLFIDAYDSFSNSIIALLKSELSVSVESIKIDDPRFVLNDEDFYRYLDGFDAVVAGPGPGHPAKFKDVGLIQRLWHLPPQHVLPVLGVCLGFQSLCHAFGGVVARLNEPRHGIMAIVAHCGKDIFAGAGKVVATQYHSLHIKLADAPADRNGRSRNLDLYEPRGSLQPLAWDLMNVVNGPTLMAVKHSRNPFWGVQYHPESICTNEAGRRLVSNWWQAVRNWGYVSGRHVRLQRICHTPPDLDQKSRKTSDFDLASSPSVDHTSIAYRTAHVSSDFCLTALMDQLRTKEPNAEPLLLESGTRGGRPVNAETGRFSIIGLHYDCSPQLRYSATNHRLTVERSGFIALEVQTCIQDVFAYLDDSILRIKASNGPQDSPFWGGYIGFISYEAGLETIGISPADFACPRPDMWFVLVDRSIVVDHVLNVAYIQTLRSKDESWLSLVAEIMQSMRGKPQDASVSPSIRCLEGHILHEPQKQDYCNRINACKTSLRAGESYELCLTAQTVVSSPAEPWPLYCHLRTRNPAPFSSFLRFSSPEQPGISIISSSPERFLSWTRCGQSQFRPIKGTVKKTAGMTRAKAETILGSPKERAENLMIVDLIRHDLSGVSGVERVRVPKLMSVEEYETVFQLVSVIEGDLAPSTTSPTAVLAASLPPGSMTGAPKKRSCELLQRIEAEQPRGLYSGVIGYLDVGGGGDFSVVIRTAFRWDDGGDGWRIGAGGAITVLSDADAEWEEMLTKRESVLGSFL